MDLDQDSVDFMASEELNVVAEINRCRTNPAEYAETALREFLACYTNEFTYRSPHGVIRTKEGRQLVEATIEELREAEPVPPLTPDSELTDAARFHCNDQGPDGLIGHDSSDGANSFERVRRFAPKHHMWCENLAYGLCVAEAIVASLVVDDGVPSRGHRKNIMRKELRHIGVAIGGHSKYAFMCTIDFSD